jgi:flagellar biosynthesis regulator FlbT
MNVKGTMFITTKVNIIAAFGEERWNSFMARLAEKDKYFKNIIMSITPIPVNKALLFFEELLKEFLNNDNKQYLMFGKAAAKFALSPGGMYHSYLLTKDVKQFVESVMPKFWSTYFDEGVVITKLENNVVHFKITGLPIKHVYFEYMVMGFNQQALKIFGKKTVVKRVRSIASGDDDVYYQFELKDS